MAGDWIKVEHSSPDKPEIDQMAMALNLDHDSVFGKCIRLWIWADQQSIDGNALTVTEPFLDRLTFCPGFAAALRKVGWLEGREGRLSIPNFTRHNGQTAKNRAQTNDRVKKKRKCNASGVTESLPEKRREEKSNKKTKAKKESVILEQLSFPGGLPYARARPLLEKWMAQCEDKDNPATAATVRGILRDFGPKGIDALEAAIRFSIRNGYRGLVDPSDRAGPKDNSLDAKRQRSREAAIRAGNKLYGEALEEQEAQSALPGPDPDY